MGKKKAGDGGSGAWNFAARFLLSAAVTAGVVSLLRGLSSEPATFEKVAVPMQLLPTLPPKTGPVKGRVLKHSNGLCVREKDSSLILSECGVMTSLDVIQVVQDESEPPAFQLRIGQRCATLSGPKTLTLPLQPACHMPEAKFRKVIVGTDLFLLQPSSMSVCLAPAEAPADGAGLILSDCTGDIHFQTSEAFEAPAQTAVEVHVRDVRDTIQTVSVSDTLVHISGLCVTAQDEITGEDSSLLVFSDCEDDPVKNVRFVAASESNVFRFQLGRQCGHPEDGADASGEPRLAFPADCASTRHSFKYRKLSEDERLPGFVIQSVDNPIQYCIHPYGGNDRPPVGTELINHKQCELGRNALRFRVGDPIQLAKEEPKMKKSLGNPLIPVPQEEPCSYYDEGKSQSSRPGKPCLPPPPFWPYTGRTDWKIQLGQRALASVTPLEEVTEQRCAGFYLLGDQTWCNKAFDGSHGVGKIGLSFGIEERDIWSELVTQKFHLPVKLFDCFIPPDRSPPISGTAPNNSECPKNAFGEPKLAEICYGASYQSFRLCLAGQDVTAGGRRYGTLEAQLRGWPKLSVHLKIDVEGSEWDVLEWLIGHPEEWDKIRTLDMEDLDLHAQLDREVKIMEDLRERFYCTGSTLEVYRQGWSPQDNCGVEPCPEPPIYLPNGFAV
ncbi:unnamed protein product, partial [Durusdinium trenchii]